MLQSTFQHVRGIGKKTELSLWNKGLINWEKYVKRNGQQLSLFESNKTDPIKDSIRAYEIGDVSFFAQTFPKAQYYRVALAYPEKTLFLDIETTGLSLYYDQITLVGWSIGPKFGVCLKDQDASGLFKALKSAKAIVTFNGTIFDLKFLDKTFPGIYIPPVHVDLRFFAKRAGLSGGQKKIEPEVGYKRPDLVEGMEGESAPILWYKYRRGDKAALKELIIYNHADIEGMKWIMDYAIEKIYDIDKIPHNIRSKPKFSELESKIDWARYKPKTGDSYKVYLPKYSGHSKPLIAYNELNKIVPLSKTTFIGIDIVSSEERESGYCILKGNKAKTSRIKTDEEMIHLAQDAGATLISIDSPLSIPRGRTSFFDDDPNRNEYGIMRECERILKRRGVNVYPCLIPSMQKLTRRGIQLATKFRKLGIPVIESYPGAAQDILAIPRKRAGLNYLAGALAEFGIYDNFTERNISHDELDAITSAIVGIFFWTGKFEGIGNKDEEYLIIPNLNADSDRWLSRKAIGLSGGFGSGKSTVFEYLKRNGFVGGSFSQIDELPDAQNIVIDGLWSPEDHALMVETFGPSCNHLHIETSFEIRKSRINDSKIEDIQIQESSNHPIESKIKDLQKLSNHIISNNGKFSELYTQMDSLL